MASVRLSTSLPSPSVIAVPAWSSRVTASASRLVDLATFWMTSTTLAASKLLSATFGLIRQARRASARTSALTVFSLIRISFFLGVRAILATLDQDSGGVPRVVGRHLRSDAHIPVLVE